MNFDNLVEDAVARGANYEEVYDCIEIAPDELQALIQEYIDIDRISRAQPTPAQIADAQIDILRKAARVLLARISLSYDDMLSHAESTNYDDVRLAASDTESDACANALLDLVDKLRKGEIL